MELQNLLIISGGIASGKSAAGEVATTLGYVQKETSGILDALLRAEGVPNPEDRNVRIQKGIELTLQHGTGIMGKLAAEAALEAGVQKVVICGIRHPDQIHAIKDIFHDALALYIDADPEIRFQRALANRTITDIPLLHKNIAQELAGTPSMDLMGTKDASDMVILNNNLTLPRLQEMLRSIILGHESTKTLRYTTALSSQSHLQ